MDVATLPAAGGVLIAPLPPDAGAALPPLGAALAPPGAGAPVPPSVAKVAGFERRQMLIECASRATLQRLLALFTPQLPSLKNAHRGIVRWAIDVDPLGI